MAVTQRNPNQSRGNLNKKHFFQIGGLGEFSRSSQGRLSVKSGNESRNEKRKNLKNCYFFGEGGKLCGLALSDTLCNKYNITEYGRSCLPCTALPYSHTAARPRWVTPFYVLRYFLRVGTLRAQDSKCHSRHFFTPKATFAKC